MYAGILFFALGLVYLVIILCMASRIQLAIAINKVAAQFVYNTKTIVLVPVLQILCAMVWWAIWMVVAVFLVSQVSTDVDAELKAQYTYLEAYGDDANEVAGKCTGSWPTGFEFLQPYNMGNYAGLDASGNAATFDACMNIPNGDDLGSAAQITNDNFEPRCYRCALPRWAITVQFAYAFFSLLWNNALLIAIGQCTIAGAVGYWYFTPNEKKGQEPVVRPAVRNCFRYHLGSLATGAFILAVVQFINWCLYYLQKQAEQAKNPVMVKICMALQYLISCFERFLKFLNKNAYIQIALLGKNFCTSAWNAFCLILRNAARIGILGGIGAVVNIIGLVFITTATTVLGYFILILACTDENGDLTISSPYVPTFLFAVMGYVIGKLIMNVFGLAVDATLQCFVADEELHSGSGAGGAQYTPELLKGFLKDPTKKKKCLCC
jgi:hypothetical protein